jgi:hypothetical protein
MNMMDHEEKGFTCIARHEALGGTVRTTFEYSSDPEEPRAEVWKHFQPFARSGTRWEHEEPDRDLWALGRLVFYFTELERRIDREISALLAPGPSLVPSDLSFPRKARLLGDLLLESKRKLNVGFADPAEVVGEMVQLLRHAHAVHAKYADPSILGGQGWFLDAVMDAADFACGVGCDLDELLFDPSHYLEWPSPVGHGGTGASEGAGGRAEAVIAPGGK